MKKIYCKPSITTVKINSSFICTSNTTVKVKGDYEEGSMTDLSRGSRFSSWSDDEE